MSADLQFKRSGTLAYTGNLGNFYFHAEIGEKWTRSYKRLHGKDDEFINANENCLVWYIMCNNEQVFEEVIDYSPNEFSKEEQYRQLKACLRNWLEDQAQAFLTVSIEDEY